MTPAMIAHGAGFKLAGVNTRSRRRGEAMRKGMQQQPAAVAVAVVAAVQGWYKAEVM